MNPRSTDCEADALTTTPSRRYAGGVGVYIRNDLKYLLKSDIVVNSEDCENIFIEIINKPSKKRQKIY